MSQQVTVTIRRIGLLLALLAVAVSVAACDQIGLGVESAAPADVAMFRGNPQRTGVYDTLGLPVYEATQWRFEADDWFFGAPAIVGDTVIAVKL